MTGQCALLQSEVGVEPCRPGCRHYRYCLSSKLVGGDLRALRRDVHHSQKVPRGERLVHSGQACHAVYVIRSGWFKLLLCDEQGNEQVVGFRGPGELVGLVDLISGSYTNEVVALQPAEVLQIPAARALATLGHDAQSEALAAMAWRVSRERKRLSGRNKQKALNRLASFLLDLWDNQQLYSGPSPRLELPMTRADIANYLGMKIETVSRCLGSLQNDSVLTARGRTIDMLDFAALRQLSDGDSAA